MNLQAVFPLHQVGAYLDTLAELRAADIAQLQVDDRPGIAGVAHLRVVVVEFVQQGAARDFQVLDVMPVPDHFHHVDVEERYDHLDFDLQYAGLTHGHAPPKEPGRSGACPRNGQRKSIAGMARSYGIAGA
ncbi:hypothetical protein D9M68_818990 [compost metagenome]